jgi:hypothetical protein
MNIKSSSNLSQKVLIEVLVEEIESLKHTKKDYEKILSTTTAHLSRLEELHNQPISIDIGPIQKEHADIRHTLKGFITIPVWLWVTLSISIIGLFLSSWYNYHQYIQRIELEEGFKYYYNAYQKLSKTVKK